MSVTVDELGLFECPGHVGHLRLSPASCASMWLRAQDTGPLDMLYPCRGCTIGSEHAGVKIDPWKLPEHVMRRCVRCARKSSRFIRGRLCVSCYNRGLEWDKQANAKGQKPTEALRLSSYELRYLDETGEHTSVVNSARSILEVVLTTARSRGRGFRCVHAPRFAMRAAYATH